jgi:hypothetical protein
VATIRKKNIRKINLAKTILSESFNVISTRMVKVKDDGIKEGWC